MSGHNVHTTAVVDGHLGNNWLMFARYFDLCTDSRVALYWIRWCNQEWTQFMENWVLGTPALGRKSCWHTFQRYDCFRALKESLVDEWPMAQIGCMCASQDLPDEEMDTDTKIRSGSGGTCPPPPPCSKCWHSMSNSINLFICGAKLSVNLLSHYLSGMLVQILAFSAAVLLEPCTICISERDLRRCGQHFEGVA